MGSGSRAISPLRVIEGLGERGIVLMRGKDNKKASRLKSYGRILKRFDVWRMNWAVSVQ